MLMSRLAFVLSRILCRVLIRGFIGTGLLCEKEWLCLRLPQVFFQDQGEGTHRNTSPSAYFTVILAHSPIHPLTQLHFQPPLSGTQR